MNALRRTFVFFSIWVISMTSLAWAQERTASANASGSEVTASEEGRTRDPMSSPTFNGLKLRSIGPAVTSGRVVGFAVDPKDRSHYFVASASGGVWKTINAGTTWTPVFDSQGSYSIGTVAVDPKNPNVVWVGTGESNSQRSVGYGDGVYRSEDGGKSWKNVGLKKSEHIARIAIDPRNSDTVYVAAEGPLWGPGGDRGLFKTVDGGKTWKSVLSISENTGISDVVIDKENPDVLYAAAYQRRRHVFTLIDGGPESALYKSTDAGATWNKLTSGLPSTDMGRIGLAIAPRDHNVVYAIIESTNKKGGIFRSDNQGASWEKRNDFDSGAMYYSQIYVDPKITDRIYIMNVFIMVSDDGGKTVRRLGERSKHVDSHVMWIDPHNTNYYLVGCDGGVYESFDRGATWAFKSNLPVTQFYDVAVDNATPFYNVYGGTQDNYSLGGPSRTFSASGITNADWFVTQGGDGFVSRVDPEDPNTIYAEAQYGDLVRFDRRTGERMGIQPQPGKNEPPLRWNWDSPLIVSPHLHTRLFFGANILFRSDDRGDTWKAISGDLTRQLDRDKLAVMGKIWGPDAVAKHQSTSFYGNIVALNESPRKEGLIYVGTDDGLIQVTEDGGAYWRKIEKFPGVPDMTYVSRILASQADVDTVYAAFDNHKNSDFSPYLLKSTDAGKNWTSIKGNLPANGPVLAIAEDPVDPKLLFVGTEFGLFFTPNGGDKWIQLKGGFPTIAVRDLIIQKRENDLVAATFGRGFYVLDNYTPLRTVTPDLFKQPAHLFPVKEAWMYIPSQPLGSRGKSFQGESFFTADNPPYGAVFTYYLKDALKTKKQKRQDTEKAAEKKNQPFPYPTPDEIRAEELEEPPTIKLTVTDDAGQVVRTMTGPITAGLQRVAWDLRYPAPTPPRTQPPSEEEQLFGGGPAGPLTMPGTYKVSLSQSVDGVTTQLAGPVTFSVVVPGTANMSSADRSALYDFQKKVASLQRAVSGAVQTANDLKTRMAAIKRALQATPANTQSLQNDAFNIEQRLETIQRALSGDSILAGRDYNVPSSISQRVSNIVGEERMSTSKPTQTQLDVYRFTSDEFSAELAKLRTLIEVDVSKLETAMEAAGAPWTPGRIPEWKEK
ncbi:MAG: glycosyl hydrolase [Acidobacteriia bacterium]|nr:glycosyl hydrolase [Terriglobia bacterium]